MGFVVEAVLQYLFNHVDKRLLHSLKIARAHTWNLQLATISRLEYMFCRFLTVIFSGFEMVTRASHEGLNSRTIAANKQVPLICASSPHP